jgi:uncharacterized protein YbbK (DUF523 family)
MPKSAKPRVVASRCLGFAACRYDGAIINDPFVRRLRRSVTFIPVCPEMEIGLGCPRDPIRIVMSRGRRRLVQPSTGRDLTELMERFVRDFVGSLGRVDGFLLKSRSPSCGIGDAKVFAGETDRVPLRFGCGFFGGAVLRGFPALPVADEVRLNDPDARKWFVSEVRRRCCRR